MTGEERARLAHVEGLLSEAHGLIGAEPFIAPSTVEQRAARVRGFGALDEALGEVRGMLSEVPSS